MPTDQTPETKQGKDNQEAKSPVVTPSEAGIAPQKTLEAKFETDNHRDNIDDALIRWTRALVWWTAALVVVGVVTAFIFWRQLNTMSGQLDEMKSTGKQTDQLIEAAANANRLTRDIFTSTERPWIRVASPTIGSPLTYDGNGDARIVINFVLTNTGKTPAINVELEAEIHPIFGDTRPMLKAVCDRQKLRSPKAGLLGISLFPGESQRYGLNLPITRAEIEAFNKNMIRDFGPGWGKGKQWITPLLVGCANYKFTFAEDHHQTPFVYSLGEGKNIGPINVEEGPVPMSKLTLQRYLGGWISAPPD